MNEITDAIERINAILRQHTDVEMLACTKAPATYDAKIKLRGAGLAILKMRGLNQFDAEGLSIYQMQLHVSDVRSDQHDRVSYEITNQLEDRPLWRCRTAVLIANGERIELL